MLAAAAAGWTSTGRRRRSSIDLQQGVTYTFQAADAGEPTSAWTSQTGNFPLPFEQFFPTMPLAKGDREMTLGELQARSRSCGPRARAATETGRFEVEYHKKFAIAGRLPGLRPAGAGALAGQQEGATLRPWLSNSWKRNFSMVQACGFGDACQPQVDCVARGIVCSNASANVCSPVMSAVNASSPFPTESGDSTSKRRNTGLCRLTRACRSIRAAGGRATGLLGSPSRGASARTT